MNWALLVMNLWLLAATAAALATTNKTSYGNDFCVGFLRQVSPTSRIEMIVLTMSSSPVQFTISSLNGSIYNGTTTAASPTNVTLSSAIQVRETTFAYRQLGLHVSSPPDQPISVVLVGYTAAPRSAYLGLPCYEQPTQEYVYYGMSNGYNEVDGSSFVYYSQILLVGCRDNTTVSITPSQTVQLPQDPQVSNSPLINVTAGSSHTVILHSLQTLLIAAELVDLSGTKIVSNYPLTVVGGHDCTRVPQPVILECDPISTQIPPTINWGTRFLLTPLNSRSAGQQFKLIASENDTEVNRTCTAGSSEDSIDLKSEGNVTTFDMDGNEFCDVSCSHPCYIAELAFSRFGSRGIGNGDPLLMTVPPISQYPHTVTFTTLPDMANFYSIAVPADSYYNGIVVINNVLTAPNWTPINGTDGSITGYGYSTAANGTFTVSHSHPNGKLYVSVYGFDSAGGYGYVAGMLLQSTGNTSSITDNESVHVIMPSSIADNIDEPTSLYGINDITSHLITGSIDVDTGTSINSSPLITDTVVIRASPTDQATPPGINDIAIIIGGTIAGLAIVLFCGLILSTSYICGFHYGRRNNAVTHPVTSGADLVIPNHHYDVPIFPSSPVVYSYAETHGVRLPLPSEPHPYTPILPPHVSDTEHNQGENNDPDYV